MLNEKEMELQQQLAGTVVSMSRYLRVHHIVAYRVGRHSCREVC